MLAALLALHGALALVALLAGRRLGRRAFLLTGLAPLATAVWAGTVAGDVVDDEPVEQSIGWVDQLDLTLDLRLDAFALLFVALIAGVGTLVFAYAYAYFGDKADLGRLAATLVAFAGSMLGLVLADDLLGVYLFWELTSVTSYLLIGYDDRNGSARAAALQALLTTSAGGLAMLAGFVLLGIEADTFSLSGVVEAAPGGVTAGVALVLILLGALTKSAQWPFHTWLPRAMAAPTPVSAYLHSATMVKAGIYLIARLAPYAADAYAWWQPVVVGLGVVTMVVGGWKALHQHDLKLLLAQGTVSQLGFMVALAGVGHPATAGAVTAVILAHGLFKASLFLTTGAIDHQAHTRDIRRLSGLGRRLPVVFAIGAAAAASMVGLPPLLGFVAKEAALEALLEETGFLAVAGIVLGSVLTTAYAARYVHGAFATKRAHGMHEPVGAAVDAPHPLLQAAPGLLAAAGIVLGVAPALADELTSPAAGALAVAEEATHLALWHGLNWALALSAAAIGGGLLLFGSRQEVERFQDTHHERRTSATIYEGALQALNRVADRTTGIVQNGSLPIYIGVILVTAIALPTSALVGGASLPDDIALAESALQVVVAVAVLGAGVAAVLAKRRFVAVVLLGAVGFGVAVLFILHGAPDLALTQLLVETLAVVVFVLVLRHLPERFESTRTPTALRLRILVAAGVGVFVTLFALIASGSRVDVPVSEEQFERALPEGGGRNVVNVILTDIRAFDTVGEITVLTVAALGIASLVRTARPGEGDDDEEGVVRGR